MSGMENLLSSSSAVFDPKAGQFVYKGRPKLVFDPTTGGLIAIELDKEQEEIDNYTAVDMRCEGFFGGSFEPSLEREALTISPTSCDKNTVHVKTMHISCQSDTYNVFHNYGGVIIYQHNDDSDWRTANDTHCKSGYMVIQDTESENVRKLMGQEPGIVHGAVYRNAFGESVNDADVVGEGFAIRNGKFEMCSSVFNNPQGSEFHDERRRMHELSEHCVRKVVEHWKTAGPAWVRERNFEVKELLKDFDFDQLYKN